jgi:hypothetical protein
LAYLENKGKIEGFIKTDKSMQVIMKASSLVLPGLKEAGKLWLVSGSPDYIQLVLTVIIDSSIDSY